MLPVVENTKTHVQVKSVKGIFLLYNPKTLLCFSDHCRLDRYRPKKGPKFNDFTFEAHIYFDDAFKDVEGSQGRHLNEYATNLVEILTEVYG